MAHSARVPSPASDAEDALPTSHEVGSTQLVLMMGGGALNYSNSSFTSTYLFLSCKDGFEMTEMGTSSKVNASGSNRDSLLSNPVLLTPSRSATYDGAFTVFVVFFYLFFMLPLPALENAIEFILVIFFSFVRRRSRRMRGGISVRTPNLR